MIGQRTVDVLVIGAGQAGLATGAYLRSSGLGFELLDPHRRVGDSWRQRYDSLVLFTPRAYSALPGMPMAGDPEGYPAKDEIADYLEAYARQLDLPVRLEVGVRRLERGPGGFRATTDGGATIIARAVVVATGAYQDPAIPAVSRGFSLDVRQLSPREYRSPGQIPGGTVLVVGDGSSGRQIARELAGSHTVILAGGRRRALTSARMLGRSSFWWMERLGLLLAPRETAIGRVLLRRDPFPGTGIRDRDLQRRGVRRVGRLLAAEGRQGTFEGGEEARIDTVIWATGYRDRTDWLAIPEAKDAHGGFVHHHGVAPVPGLYYIGRPGQRTHGSSRLYGVGPDAAAIVGRLVRDLQGQAAAPLVAGVAGGMTS